MRLCDQLTAGALSPRLLHEGEALAEVRDQLLVLLSVCVCVFVCTCTCIYMSVYVCLYVNVVCMCVCAPVYVYVPSMYMCNCVCDQHRWCACWGPVCVRFSGVIHFSVISERWLYMHKPSHQDPQL